VYGLLNHAFSWFHGELKPKRLDKEESNDVIIQISFGVLSCFLGKLDFDQQSLKASSF